MLCLDLNGDWSGNRLLLIPRPPFWLKYGYLLCSLGLTMCRMFRSSSEALPSWIRLARFNRSSSCSYLLYPLISGYIDLIRHWDSIGSLKADARVVPGSRPRLGLIFTRVYACRQIVESTFAPSWSGYRSGGTPCISESIGVCQDLGRWQRDRCQPAPRQPPGSSCCLSLLAGGFWPTTDTYPS